MDRSHSNRYTTQWTEKNKKGNQAAAAFTLHCYYCKPLNQSAWLHFLPDSVTALPLSFYGYTQTIESIHLLPPSVWPLPNQSHPPFRVNLWQMCFHCYRHLFHWSFPSQMLPVRKFMFWIWLGTLLKLGKWLFTTTIGVICVKNPFS